MPQYEVVIEGTQGGEDMLNVLHYQVDDASPPDWQAGADEIRSHLSNYLAQYASPNVFWGGITVREDSPGQVGVFYPFTLGNLQGTDANGDQVRQVAVLVRKRASSGFRPALGWFFQGGITVHGTVATGTWETDILTAVENYATDIMVLGAVTPLGAYMVIKARNPTAPNTVAYNPVTSFQAVANPRTVRSRTAGTGT